MKNNVLVEKLPYNTSFDKDKGPLGEKIEAKISILIKDLTKETSTQTDNAWPLREKKKSLSWAMAARTKRREQFRANLTNPKPPN